MVVPKGWCAALIHIPPLNLTREYKLACIRVFHVKLGVETWLDYRDLFYIP